MPNVPPSWQHPTEQTWNKPLPALVLLQFGPHPVHRDPGTSLREMLLCALSLTKRRGRRTTMGNSSIFFALTRVPGVLAGTCQLHSHKVMDGLVTNLPVLTWRGSLSFSLFFFFKQKKPTHNLKNWLQQSQLCAYCIGNGKRTLDWLVEMVFQLTSSLTYCSPTEIASSHSNGLRPKQMSDILPRTKRCCTFTNYFIIMQSLSPFSTTFQLRNLTLVTAVYFISIDRQHVSQIQKITLFPF